MSTRFVLKLAYRGECVRVRPEPQYCNRYSHVLEYVRETWPELARTEDFGVYYYDEAGDRCTLNERTFPDCLMLLQERNTYKDTEELPVLKLKVERHPGHRPLVSPLPRPAHVMEAASRRIEQKMGWDRMRSSEPVSKGGYEGMQAKPVVHHGFICDGCEMDPLVGDRYKCNYCEDFDFCAKCFDKRLLLGHNPFHAFTCHKTPRKPLGNTSARTSTTSSGSDKNTMTSTNPREEKSVGDAPVTPPTKTVGTLPEPRSTRDESVQWENDKHCMVSGPWGSLDIFVDKPTDRNSPALAAKVLEACAAAKRAMGQAIAPPFGITAGPDSFAVDAGIHLGIECDLCGELPIVGARYKCTICPDYDLCEKCFAFTSPSKSHEHCKSSFRKLSPLDTIEIRKNPEIWTTRQLQQPAPSAPTVAVPTEAPVGEPEVCGGPMFGPIALISPEPEPAGVVESTDDNISAVEPEIGEEIEMEEPPAESTYDDQRSTVSASDSLPESWMDLGEMDNTEDDIMLVGTPRSAEFEVIEPLVDGELPEGGDDVQVAEVRGPDAGDRLAEALVEHGVVEDREKASLLIGQVSASQELRGMLNAFLSETQ
ncbi:hypothetical protein FOZ62_017670 [Perkinsus olseni]|uniref:ZZ-type domain-containing protein n=1 Tax=Perkinsus olseni TaxID=32597 RepID=A0A7J6UAD9_PEROL|nr:hypothetical protein FOZ62_017670 [Perkinsus olseni]